MFNRQTPVNLSFQDRYILAFDRPDLPFNSHLVLEMESEPDIERLKSALCRYFELEQFSRIVPDIDTGLFYLQPFDEEKISRAFIEIRHEQFEKIWDKAFDFENEYGLKLIYCPGHEVNRLVISCHHSLYDGHAQFNMLKDLMDLYSGAAYQPRRQEEIYRFRRYFIKTKFSWLSSFVKGTFKSKAKTKKIRIARLWDKEPVSRKVVARTFSFDRSLLDKKSRRDSLSVSSCVSLIGAKAADKLLLDKNIVDDVIVLFITKSMRFELKATRALQNLVGFIWMKLDRQEMHKKDFTRQFRETYKFRSSDSEVRKTLFGAALISYLVSFKKLKGLLETKERRKHDCTLIISSGRTPKELVFPADFKMKALIARGTMHRSPGIGLMVTSLDNQDFITVEYLEDAFFPETIDSFCRYLLQEIQS